MRQVKFNRFWHPNEHPQRIFWYLVKPFDWGLTHLKINFSFNQILREFWAKGYNTMHGVYYKLKYHKNRMKEIGIIKQTHFFYLLSRNTLFSNFDHVPPLPAAPLPPRGLQHTPKKALRCIKSGLKRVEKLQFWLGFEPTLMKKIKKRQKNNIWSTATQFFLTVEQQ